jgi:PAS domain S-box-containing protein
VIPALAAALVASALTAVTIGIPFRKRRRRIERELLRDRDIAEIACDWSWETDASRRFTFLSDSLVAATGIPAAKLIDRSIAEVGEIGVEFDEVPEFDRVVAARAPFANRVNRIRFSDGRVRFWRTSGKPVFDKRTGEFLGYRGITSDVTEDVERENALTAMLSRAETAEEEARRTRTSLLDAIDVVPAGYVQWDAEDRLVLCNARYRELYYKMVDQSIPGARFDDIVRAEAERGQYQMADQDRERWISDRIARHRACSRSERRLADGRWIQVDERRTIDRGIVGIHVDVSEARQREAAEREREKLAALGQLAGGVAHEINNLLQPMITFPELISERLPPDDVESREDLASVLDSARKAREIVRNILLFARKEEPTLAPLDLAAEVSAALNFLRDLLPPTVAIAEPILEGISGAIVAANRTQLMQVLTNLAVNAAHAIRDHGTITIAVTRLEPLPSEAVRLGIDPDRVYLAVAVKDAGCGMDAATQARIFEPFFTTKPIGQGTGLGLSVAHSILQSWGGSIAVRSAPGRGSTFTLYVPELASAETAALAFQSMTEPAIALSASS